MKITPTYMLENYRCVTADFLRERGIRFLLTDLDNTLAPYEQPEPDDEHRAWLADLRASGVQVALVSNNEHERVERFNATLGLPAYAKSGKPAKRALLRAMRELGADRSNTAVLGDQLLTDSYAGRRLGLPTLIVPPIRDKQNMFFRFKRRLERPFVRKYAKRNGWEPFMAFWKIGKKKEERV